MKKMISILLCLLLPLYLFGCFNPEAESAEYTEYGVTERACPVYAKVKTDGDGKILEAEFGEFLSVYDIGNLTKKDGKWYKCGVEIAEQEDGYARNVRVGDVTFRYEDGSYSCPEIVGSLDAETFAKRNGKRLIHWLEEGNFDIADEEGKDYGVPFDEYDGLKLKKTDWADKMKNGFREGAEYDNGWKEQIYTLVTHLKNHGFYDYTGSEKRGKGGTYKVGRYDTLVSLENFHDYMQLAQKAYEKARKNLD